MASSTITVIPAATKPLKTTDYVVKALDICNKPADCVQLDTHSHFHKTPFNSIPFPHSAEKALFALHNENHENDKNSMVNPVHVSAPLQQLPFVSGSPDSASELTSSSASSTAENLNYSSKISYSEVNFVMSEIGRHVFGSKFCQNYFSRSFNTEHPVCTRCDLYPIDLDYCRFFAENNYQCYDLLSGCCLNCLFIYHRKLPSEYTCAAPLAKFIELNPRKRAEHKAYYSEEIVQDLFCRDNKAREEAGCSDW
jgi:hypothetical protein